MNNAPRIALYSHDTRGLGHIRRTSLLARALRTAVEPDPRVDGIPSTKGAL